MPQTSVDTPSIQAQPQSTSRILAVLLSLNVLSLIDRNLFQSFVVDIRSELQLSFLEFNILNGPVIDVSIMVAALITGSLADRFNRVRLLTGAVICWSLAMVGISFSANFWQMILPLSMMAAAISALAPAAVSIINDIAPEDYQTRYTATFYLGVPVGVGASLLVAGGLGGWLGWRHCFQIMGAVGLMTSLALLLIRDPRHQHHQTAPSLGHIIRDSWQALHQHQALRAMVYAAVLIAAGQTAHNIDQAWLVREKGYEVVDAQLTFGLILLAFGLLGTILGGMLGDYFQTKHPRGRIILLGFVCLLTIPFELLYRFYPGNDWIFYSIVALGSMLLLMPFGPMMASIADLAPDHTKATLISFTLIAMAIGGSVFGNMATGYLVDWLIEKGSVQPLTYGLFSMGLLPALAAPLLFRAAKRPQGQL